ncbi:MAG TPA: peptide-methionine (S)-S-oxide reductase MsrA [Clostridia bacterium]|jgi:methionine-S-sulfoxide reductase|nr:peptide-methionine (S)-S-oxide reductase MsrA [Clostridia bacterium]
MIKEIYFAGGCFWGLEKFFGLVDGVISTEVGYANGETLNPTYEQVCNDSGHAETVKVIYNSSVITLTKLLQKFFLVINPYSINRQGGDIGVQYRTGVYFVDDLDYEVIKLFIDLEQAKTDKKIVVEVVKLKNYYQAEEYHQKYLDKNPFGYCHLKKADFEKARN